MEFLVTVVGIKGIILALIVLWLVWALIKRLFKLAVAAAVIFALVYYVYPMVSAAFAQR